MALHLGVGLLAGVLAAGVGLLAGVLAAAWLHLERDGTLFSSKFTQICQGLQYGLC